MKSLKIALFLIIAFMFNNIFSNQVHAAGSLELENLPIEITDKSTVKKPLTNVPIEMYGPYAETNFYYELLSTINPNNYYVQFNITNSELLIDSSSLTISIDGEPVKTISLVGKNSQIVRVNLVGNALTKGVHTITASFTGLIKEGVCVPQYSTGNWMTIQLNSFINIDSARSVSNVSLDSYPELFTGTVDHKINVIIPKAASNETLKGAHIIANYLSSISDTDSVSVVTEDEVKKLEGNIILIGGKSEFKSSWILEVIKKSVNQLKDDELFISHMQLKNKENAVDALVVLSNDPIAIAEKSEVLTIQHFIDQLSDESLKINELPSTKKMGGNGNVITFSEIGLTDIMFDNLNTKTDEYFFYLPKNKMEIERPSIELHLKRSDIIDSYQQLSEKTDSIAITEGKVELIVYINRVPHAVDIQSLEEDEAGNLFVNIPIDVETLGDSQLLTLQIETNGLKIDNPCVSTDQKKWLYVFDDSKIVIPTVSKNIDFDYFFNSFPFPFVNETEDMFIILPEKGIPNKDLQNLFEVLRTNNKLSNFSILKSNEVTEEILSSGNLIFIGGGDDHKQLQSKAENLIVKEINNVPKLEEYGFLQPEVKYYSYMQKNPWNEKQYDMVVFDSLNNTNQYFSKEILAFVRDTDKKVSVVVQTGPDKLFTNAENVQTVQDDESTVDTLKVQQSSIFTWSIGFGVILLLIIVTIFIYTKQRKYLNKIKTITKS